MRAKNEVPYLLERKCNMLPLLQTQMLIAPTQRQSLHCSERMKKESVQVKERLDEPMLGKNVELKKHK